MDDDGRDLRIPTMRWSLPMLHPSRYKAVHGGRSSSKSHFFAELSIEKHVQDPNRSTVCIREVMHTIKLSSKRLIEKKIREFGLDDYFEIQDMAILSRYGTGRFAFMGMRTDNADNIKSLEDFDCAWVDEAQTLSKRSLEFLRPTIRKDGSEIWFSWNPDEPNDPVDDFFRCNSRESIAAGVKPPEDAIILQVNYDDNERLPDAAIKEIEIDRKRDPDEFAHTWLGGYRKFSNATVFSDWRIDDLTAPPNAQFRFGADFGFSPDPTVIVRCWFDERVLYVDREAYSTSIEIDDMAALFMTIPGSADWPLVADSSDPRTISHLRTHGFPAIAKSAKGQGSVEEGVKFLKSHTIVVDRGCENLIRELKRYRRKVDDAGKVLPIFEDKHNHVIDALRYACEAKAHQKFGPPPAVIIPTMNRFARR